MEEEQKTPLTDYYSKPYQGKRYRKHNSESLIVAGVIKILAWIALFVGIIDLFSDFGYGSWIYGLCIIVLSVLLFGFSAIVKAAYKYLDD